MSGLRALVKDGRIIVDQPTDLPEGTVLDLVIDDEGDNLDDAERAALHESIRLAWEEVKAGDIVPAEELLAELRQRR
ncbi:MAG: hypothetical protein AAF533_03725 [Acidobacteriota bacterium]